MNENRGYQSTLLVENTLNFNKRLGEHSVNAVAGYSEQSYRGDNTSARSTGFQSVPQYYFVQSASTNATPTVGGGQDEWAKRSFFGQVNYDFKNRYLLTGSFRRDGSSRFDRTRQ